MLSKAKAGRPRMRSENESDAHLLLHYLFFCSTMVTLCKLVFFVH